MTRKTDIPISMYLHNKYEINIIDKDNNVIKRNIAYNQADPKPYIACGYIDQVAISGSTTQRKNIEPYPELEDDPTDYWDREGLPYVGGNSFISCYKTQVKFFNIAAGYIDKIELLSNGGVVSTVQLKDIEGFPIKITYEENNNILINIFIYFKADVSKKDANANIYPIVWYNPSGSVLGGSCGKQLDLLEIPRARYNHNGVLISDGYLPKAVNKYIAVSKSPMPKVDGDGYLTGIINNYVCLFPNLNVDMTHYGDYKNSTVYSSPAILGLLRTFVLPGIGAMDMREVCGKYGPNDKGIFEGNIYYNKEKPCYIPQEYVEEKDSSLISITKNAFYNAKVIVRRYKNNIDDAVVEMPLNEVFFSDITLDGRQRRCMGFSQHVPLTDDYCGAETVIPCGPGTLKDTDIRFYGYYITFVGGDVENSYLKANYAVSGQIVIESYDGQRDLITFPYKLEYSFDGVDFETAVEFTSTSRPYTAKSFQSTAAPIWRITSDLNAGSIYRANNTTHSDKHVAEASNINDNGYDPLFIFVGFHPSYGNPEVPEGVSVISTPQFLYGQSMGSLPKYKLKVPYLGHYKDKLYFSSNYQPGILTGGEERE